MAATAPVSINIDNNNPQASYDQLYGTLNHLLNYYYPEHSVTLISGDPPYITPAIKYMLRRKNYLMRLGKSEQAGRIGVAIKEYNSAELSQVDVMTDPRSM